ncbi:conserved hypothetical protein [Candidatus Caldarchaeum subterraneum]|uniref:rRNA small subunit methyltransferase F RNA-binding PUA-like domain-containing protein n=1 Tax=Caldiarchaeum subterraneum TaxID=311458 RepID=E6N8P2_CALS0|nr:conserved hypothetical protein [Candidatus Caldarchaeum subterraneum]BAJ51366.1 conserved hypothetical protein [Candidatus Caldarchaeum subterraneum]
MKKMERHELQHLSDEVLKGFGARLLTEGYVFVKTGEGKVRALTEEAYRAATLFRGVMNAGIYVAKQRKNFVTLTIEGCKFVTLPPEAHVVELTKEDALKWMRGDPVKVGKQNHKTVIGRYREHLLGTAVVDINGVAYPQVPKWRRLPPDTS